MREMTSNYIIGIGASAGGLEAINQFFKAIPYNIGMTFIICTDIDVDNKSHFADILRYQTQLDVKEITDGMCIDQNTIYIVPQSKEVEINKDTFVLDDKDNNVNKKIDRLFNSLGKEKKEKAIGIILSGRGKDGSEGVRTIYKEKGLVIVQNEDTAEFIDKPRNAAATGAVDYVLAPSKMLEVILKHMNKEDIPVEFLGNHEMEETFYKIVGVIKEYTGIDFLAYKKNTISRRIQLRMRTLDIKNPKEYLDYLRKNPKEASTLYEDICVGVTQFFRDEDAFKILEEEVIPNIFKDKSKDDEIRIWVTACSTGEEVYSILILLEEYFEKIGESYQVKVFATDMNEKSLSYASKGIYSEESLIKISPERKEKYFTYSDKSYCVNQELRNKVLFSKHNLIKDIPFSNLDFITCRNLLIYLEEETQQTILSLFHFSLNHNGYLFLGSSESIGSMSRYFEAIDSKWRIYKYAGQVKRPRVKTFESKKITQYQQKTNKTEKYNSRIRENTIEKDIQNVLEDLGKMYIPKGVIIDETHELIHAIGDVNDYIRIPLSRISLNIFKMIKPELSVPVGTAIHNVLKENKICKYKNIRIKEANGYKEIKLSVIPFVNHQIDKRYIAVLFQECDETIYDYNDSNIFTENKVYERIHDLEDELNFNKEHLQAVIEELEVSNEELISSNEDLQNTNDELQSVNEELYMVNGEYQSKLEEISQAQEDIRHLVKVADINIIYLDKELCIRKFTSGMGEIMNLNKKDVGRPIFNIVNTLKYNDFFNDIQDVLINLKEKEEIVKDNNGLILKVKIMPDLNKVGIIKGVIINIVDITSIVNNQQFINMLQEL